MPHPRLPHPKLDRASARRIASGTEVYANFLEIARLINGNLGVENLKRCENGVLLTMLERPASMMNVRLCLDTTVATWVNPEILVKLPAGIDVRIVEVVVSGASAAFSAEVKNGVGVLGTIKDPESRSRFSYRRFDTAAVPGGSTLTLNVTGGTLKGTIGLELAADHQAG